MVTILDSTSTSSHLPPQSQPLPNPPTPAHPRPPRRYKSSLRNLERLSSYNDISAARRARANFGGPEQQSLCEDPEQTTSGRGERLMKTPLDLLRREGVAEDVAFFRGLCQAIQRGDAL
jgi:hypothetical protein